MRSNRTSRIAANRWVISRISGPRNNDLGVAGLTFIIIASFVGRFALNLQKRFFSTVETFYAKPMLWCGGVSVYLANISKSSDSNVVKAVSGLLSIPCFEASYFLFQRAYAVQQLRLALVRRNRAVLSI